MPSSNAFFRPAVSSVSGVPSFLPEPVGGVLLGGFRIVRLEPVHQLLLVELGAHSEHGVGEAASDLGDSFRRKLVENADAHLNGL